MNSTVTDVTQRRGQVISFVHLWLLSDHDYKDVLPAVEIN